MLLSATLACGWAQPGAASPTRGLPPVLQTAAGELHLVACGVRDTLWIDHYVAGLYLAPGEKADAVRDAGKPKAVRIRLLSTWFMPTDIPLKWRRALQTELDREPLQLVRRAYGDLARNDVVTFVYWPGAGVTMRVNGALVMRSGGHAVVDSILEAWAGRDPLSGKLERLALDHSC